jgi:hypothetical protein
VKAEGVTLVGHVDDLSTIFDSVRLTGAPLSYAWPGPIATHAATLPCVKRDAFARSSFATRSTERDDDSSSRM